MSPGVPPDDGTNPLQDDIVLDEIDLTSRLIIAASNTDGTLSEDELDAVLGITGTDEEESSASP